MKLSATTCREKVVTIDLQHGKGSMVCHQWMGFQAVFMVYILLRDLWFICTQHQTALCEWRIVTSCLGFEDFHCPQDVHRLASAFWTRVTIELKDSEFNWEVIWYISLLTGQDVDNHNPLSAHTLTNNIICPNSVMHPLAIIMQALSFH